MSEEIRVVLVGAAKAAHDQMLAEILADRRTSISSSRLLNWIAVDYFEHFFKRRKKQLCKEHFNERKCLQEAMKLDDPEMRRKALQEAVNILEATQTGPRKKKQNSSKPVDEKESGPA